MSVSAASPRTKNARPVKPYRVAAYLCGYCGVPFAARVLNRPAGGRYCSASCKQMAYVERKRKRARRDAARAAVLAAVGL
jgi:hypothetical protein